MPSPFQYDAEKAPAGCYREGYRFYGPKDEDIAKIMALKQSKKPLAQVLYKSVDIGQQVPPELYQAVAEILAFVYQLKGKVPARA